VRIRHPRAVLLLSVTGFVILAATVLAGSPPLDRTVREALLGAAGPAVVAVMRVVNHGGEALVLAPGTVLLLLLVPRARQGWWVWVALMVAAPLAEGGLKFLIGRPRPEGSGLAFPSGHATAAAAFFGAVFYLAGTLEPPVRRIVRWLAVVAIVLIAVARVVLRAHWPSDVLGGIALGLALASAAALVDAARAGRRSGPP
jgi:membrane-associated phospholipid phosphatase